MYCPPERALEIQTPSNPSEILNPPNLEAAPQPRHKKKSHFPRGVPTLSYGQTPH